MKRTFLFAVFIGIMLSAVTGGLTFAQTSIEPNVNPNISGYFIGVNGQPTGPYDAAGLKALVEKGQLTRNSLVWKEGMTNWAAAGMVEELAPLFAAAPPPLPASQPPPPIPAQDSQETAQTDEYKWYNSFARGLQTNRVFINTGAGYGFFGGYNIGIPPVSLSMDIKISNVVPITIGATGIFSTWEYTTGNSPYTVSVTYMNIGIGSRAMYHFNFARNLDTYIGFTLGYVIQSASIIYGSGYTSGNRPVYGSQSFFLYGGNMGIRYFFTKGFGVYFEGGYSGLQFASAGLSIKI
jgi:hypothetical protein